jgi:hypothetical protein
MNRVKQLFFSTLCAFFLLLGSTANSASGGGGGGVAGCKMAQLEQVCAGQESFGGVRLICIVRNSGGVDRCYGGGCDAPVIRITCGGF